MAFGLCGRLVHVGQKWAVLPAPCLAVLKILSLPVYNIKYITVHHIINSCHCRNYYNSCNSCNNIIIIITLVTDQKIVGICARA